MESNDRLSYGRLLQQLRIARGITQEQLADLATISKITISSHERGLHKSPYRHTLETLAGALELTPDEREQLFAAAKRVSRPRKPAPKIEATNHEVRGNLGAPLADLVGRSDLIGDIISQLKHRRHVTLLGAGGVGKTSVARAAAHAARPHFSEGVWLEDFTPLNDGAFVVDRLAAVLGLRQSSGPVTAAQLCAFLGERRILIVLDNCERVAAGAALLVEGILSACSGVRILVTSREALRSVGESILEVPPLPFPSLNGPLSSEKALRYASVALFVERARSADADFQLNEGDVVTVAHICRRLDGLPLGIELASSKVRALGLSELVRLIDDRLGGLSGGSRSGPAHHRTIASMVEWSFGLLSSEEQSLLRQCAIFSGGWSLQAAARVCDFEAATAGNVAELHASLVGKSMLVVEHSDPRRYRMLEVIREYAADRLDETGEREHIASRHAQWVRAYTDDAVHVHDRRPRREWLALITPEAENVRAALAWTLGPGSMPSVALNVAFNVCSYWYDQGLSAEGRAWIEALKRRVVACADPEEIAMLAMAESNIAVGRQRIEAAERAVLLCESLGKRRRLPGAYLSVAVGYRQCFDSERALDAIDRSLLLFRECGDEKSIHYASALGWRASILAGLGSFKEARELFEEDIAILHGLGDRDRMAVEMFNLAELEVAMDHPSEAARLIVAGRAILDETSSSDPRVNDTFYAAALLNEAACEILTGELSVAMSTLREALSRSRRVQYPIFLAIGLQHVALLAALRGDTRFSASLLGLVDSVYREERMNREPTETKLYNLLVRTLRDAIDEDELARLSKNGSRLDIIRITDEWLAVEHST